MSHQSIRRSFGPSPSLRENSAMSSGRCACGGVRYTTSRPLRAVVNCHCERCRRISGHFMAATGCHPDGLHLDTDETLRWYEPVPGVAYGFCGTCGATLFWRADDVPGWISITAGTLDPPTGLTTTSAWWTGAASDYHRLDRSLAEHVREP